MKERYLTFLFVPERKSKKRTLIKECPYCGVDSLEVTSANIYFPCGKNPAVDCSECGEVILLEVEKQADNLTNQNVGVRQ